MIGKWQADFAAAVRSITPERDFRSLAPALVPDIYSRYELEILPDLPVRKEVMTPSPDGVITVTWWREGWSAWWPDDATARSKRCSRPAR
jgi:hypothetical protein